MALMMLENPVARGLRRSPQPELSFFQKRFGSTKEAILRNQALDASGLAHDLPILSVETHRQECCEFCGMPVGEALPLDGFMLCSECYDDRYNELGVG